MQRIKIVFRMVLVGSFISTGCATNLSPHSCEVMPQPDQDGNVQVDTRSHHDKNHRCSELDAAAYLLASLVRESSKGDECKNKSGKSRTDCEKQVKEITASINKHNQKN